MSIVEFDASAFAREASTKVQTYEARAEVRRIRLTQAEVEGLRYVLTDWASECGVGSVSIHEATVDFEAKVHAAVDAAKTAPRSKERPSTEFDDVLDHVLRNQLRLSHGRIRSRSGRAVTPSKADQRRWSRWQRKDDTLESMWQMLKVKGPPAMARPDQMAPAEAWVDKSNADQRFRRLYDKADRPVQLPGPCDQILHCWRALAALARARSGSLVILNALYGDTPPGLPARGLWSKTLDMEYRRVCRYAPSAGGSVVALEAMVGVEKHRRAGEGDANWKDRVASAMETRRARLARVGEECERMIVAAAVDYRAAFRQVQP